MPYHLSKNILEICLSPDLGGLELYMYKLCRYLNTKENLISIVNKDGKLKKNFLDSDISFFELERKSFFSLFSNAFKIAKIIDEHDIDLLHLHWTKDLPTIVLAKTISKKSPKIVQTRHMHMTRFKSDFYHRWLYKNIDLIIAVTKRVQSQIEEFIPQDIRPKVVTSYIGAAGCGKIEQNKKCELQEKYGIENSSFVVGIVGRIEEPKGQYLLIDAIKKLKNENLDVKGLIIGHAMNESYLKKLQEDVVQNSLEESVIFSGFTNEVQAHMQLCDAIVLATYKETFGLVLIEAMQCGICVIGSNDGGPLEIIDDMQNGLLFESRDVDSLAKKIALLYNDKDLTEKLAESGRKKAQEVFDEVKRFEEVNSILESI